MLLFMLPLITAASFMGDFLEYYPRASRINIYNPEPHHYFWFEVVYALDFISIEVFFRGFMILAFLKILGPKAIIPTAAFYFSIHFGKPIGETISSFFGGVLLGYLSYRKQSIWGGILVHIGIALLMELGAFIGLMLI
jgi:membrane protease YdiL (CAAX protease family)